MAAGSSVRHDTEGAADGDEERVRKLHRALHLSVDAVARAPLDEATGERVPVSKAFVHVLNELVFDLTSQLAGDLESFAHHAKRRQVTADDVLLAARRNDSLLAKLRVAQSQIEERAAAKASASGAAGAARKRKPNAGAANNNKTPTKKRAKTTSDPAAAASHAQQRVVDHLQLDDDACEDDAEARVGHFNDADDFA